MSGKRLNNDTAYRNWMHYCAVTIIAVGILALMVVPAWSLINKSKNDIHKCRIEIVHQNLSRCDADSLGCFLTKSQLDSIINQLEYHEAVLDNKYQTLLSQRQDEEWSRNLFLYIFGIVISVLGYFGYKSFDDIEQKSYKKAREVAETKAVEVATSQAITISSEKCPLLVASEVESYLNRHLPSEVQARIEGIFTGQGMASIRTEIFEKVNEVISQRYETLIQEVTDAVTNIVREDTNSDNFSGNDAENAAAELPDAHKVSEEEDYFGTGV